MTALIRKRPEKIKEKRREERWRNREDKRGKLERAARERA